MKTLKILIFIISLSFLSGCSVFTKREIIVQKEYVARTAPSHYFEVPEYPALINLENATQKEVSSWINRQYRWGQSLKAKLMELETLQDQFVFEIQKKNKKEAEKAKKEKGLF